MCSFDLWKKGFGTFGVCVFLMKDLDLTWTLTVNRSSRLCFRVLLFSFFSGVWRGSAGWSEVLLKPHHCCAEFCILNSEWDDESICSGISRSWLCIKEHGERETKLCGCSWTKTLNTFAVSRDFICISLCCYRGSMMRNRFSLHAAHLTLRGRG